MMFNTTMFSTTTGPLLSTIMQTTAALLNATMSNNTNVSNTINACQQYTKDSGIIAYVVFMVFVLILAVLGNTLVCIAISLSPKLRENPTSYFIFSLAISDMSWAMIQTPIKVSINLHQWSFCSDIHICRLFVLSDLITTPAMISTLFVIAIDRFLCVTRPFLYQELMTKKKAKLTTAGVWLYACIWPCLVLFSWNKSKEPTIQIIRTNCVPENKYFYMTSYFLVTLVPLVIMGVTYFVILRVARKQIRAIRETEVLMPRKNKEGIENARVAKAHSRRTHRELRATATLAIVYGAFVVCWLPPCIINLIIALQKDNGLLKLKKTHPGLLKFLLYTFFEILPLISSAINPIIYNVFNKQFRTAFKVVMYRLVGKKDLLRRATIIKEFGDYRTRAARAASLEKKQFYEMKDT